MELNAVWVFVALIAGSMVGRWIEAQTWRDKANTNRYKKSGGRLYRVQQYNTPA